MPPHWAASILIKAKILYAKTHTAETGDCKTLLNAVQIGRNRLLAVLDERLINQGVILEKFVQFTLRDAINHLFRLAFQADLLTGNF